VTASTWDAYTDGMAPEDLALLERWRAIATAWPDVEERVSRTLVQWAVTRAFTSAYVKSHWLEVSVDLTREAEHPELRAVIPTTKVVRTHRLRFKHLDEIDDAVVALVGEAHETVGPGLR
jgi:hypothetical protein